MGDIDWRRRFRAPQIWAGTVARRRPDRGLVVANQDGRSIQLHAWEVASGGLTALTGNDLGVVDGWIDPLGDYVYYLRDEGGNELGHVVRVPFGGGDVVDLTPDLPAYTLRGLGFSGDGTVVAINPVNDDGFAVYTVDVAERIGPPRLVHRDRFETWGALLSARGDLAACWSSARSGGLRRYTLLVFDVATGDLVGELNDGPEAKVTGICFSNVDGDDRILAGTTRDGFLRPVIWHPRTGERIDAPLAGLRTDMAPLDWSLDARQVLLGRLGGDQRLHRYDLDTDRVVSLDHPHGSYYDSFGGGALFGPDGSVIGRRAVAETPAEVVSLDAGTGELREVLLRPGAAPAGQPWRSVTFPSSDGTTVQAWLATPPGPGPFPTVLEAHGGPHWAFEVDYSAGAQCWVDHGYAWLGVNFRGSLGFGRDFAEQIWGDLGRWELEDLVAARDHLVTRGITQPDEVLVHGASYGGYLTLFALGRRPDLWLGGLAIVADADLAACWEDSSEALRGALTAWMKGTPQERPEAYAASSPITYAADVTAPVLVLQARNDTRVPARQMELYERRMRELGKDIEVIWLDGGHQSVGPDTLVGLYETMLAFAGRVLAAKRAGA